LRKISVASIHEQLFSSAVRDKRRQEVAVEAVCVKPDRSLEVRDVPTPTDPPAGHLLVEIDACAINHGDKAFLARALATVLASGPCEVWGASAVGRVVATGADVPEAYAGKQVAIYRSLHPTPETIGLWCERAQVHHQSCLILPDQVRGRDYCGSLVNVITAYAFLRQAADEGHRGIVATAGNSATAHALAALARGRDTPVIHLVRSASARDELRWLDVEHVLVTTDEGFEREFGALAQRLDATAVFDGVGGDLANRLAPHLPQNSTFYFYGFLGGAAPISIPTLLFMTKNLTMKRFSNFESATVKDRQNLATALVDLQARIGDSLFRTNIGKEFRFDEIDAAMRFEVAAGAKAVLVASPVNPRRTGL
jgi:NADPH:quinone reductase